MTWMDWADDKTQVIAAVVVLSIIAMVIAPDQAVEYLDVAFAGLFGIAIGNKIK